MDAPSVRITREVYRSSELDGYEVCVVDITEEYAAKLLGYMGLVHGLHAMDPQIYQLRIWDFYAEYFPRNWDADEDVIEPESGAEAQRTECDLLAVDRDSVRWTALAKHTDAELESEEMTREDLQEIHDKLKTERQQREMEVRSA